MSRRVAGVAIPGILVAVAFWPVLAGRQTFFGVLPGTLSPPPPATAPFLIDPQDTVWQCYPWARLVRESWTRGELPLWTPRTGMGEPLVAPTIGSVTSPLRWWVAVADPTARRWDLFLLARLWLTAVLAWGWAVSLGLPAPAAFVTAAAWVLSGHLVRNLNQAFLDADIWLPALAWAAWGFARAPSALGWVGLAAAGGAVMLAGNPQPAVLAGAFVSAVVVAGALRGARGPGGVRMSAMRRIGAGGLAAVTAAALAAPFLVPFGEAWPRMQNVHAGQGTVAEPVAGAISLVAPWLLGRFGDSWLGLNPNHFLAWLGVSVVVLAFAGVRPGWRHPAGPVLAAAPVLLLAAAYGIWPMSWVARLPVLNAIWWSKYQGVTALCVATLAGFGATRLAGRAGFRVLVPACVLFELMALMPRARPRPFDPVRPGPAVAWLAARADPREDRAWAIGRTPMPQPLAAAGIADARTYYGLYPRRAYWWVRGLITGPAPTSNEAVFTGSDRPLAKTAPAALSAAGVRWIIAPGPLRDAVPGWVLRARLDLSIYENLRAGPRGWVAERAVGVPSPEAALWETSGDPGNHRIVVVEAPADWIGFAARSRPRSARVVADDGNRLTVSVPGDGLRVLVVADTFEPGWKAFAGDRRLRVWPANCAFRAVAVPPGASRVEFRYDPLPVKLGVRLFGVAAGVLLGVIGIAGRRSGRARRRR